MAEIFFNQIIQHSKSKISQLKTNIQAYQQQPQLKKDLLNDKNVSINQTIHNYLNNHENESPIKNKKSQAYSKSTLHSTVIQNPAIQQITLQLKKTQDKKRALLLELKEVDNKLHLIKKQKQIITRKSVQLGERYIIQKSQQALQLVRRMNKERKEKELRKLRQNQNQKKEIDRTIQKLQEMKKKQSVQKLQRRKLIQQFIKQSKSKHYILNIINKKSDALIKEVNQPQKIFDFTQVEESKVVNNQIKKYPKTSFLKIIEQEDKKKKQQNDIRQKQKFLMLEKRKSYNFLLKPLPAISHKNHKNEFYKYPGHKSRDYIPTEFN